MPGRLIRTITPHHHVGAPSLLDAAGLPQMNPTIPCRSHCLLGDQPTGILVLSLACRGCTAAIYPSTGETACLHPLRNTPPWVLPPSTVGSNLRGCCPPRRWLPLAADPDIPLSPAQKATKVYCLLADLHLRGSLLTASRPQIATQPSMTDGLASTHMGRRRCSARTPTRSLASMCP